MTTLGDLAIKNGIQTGPFGSQLHASDYTDHGVGVVMPQDLGDNVVRPDAMARVAFETATELSRHRLQPGDIVFSRRGDVTRRALIRDADGDLLCGTGCLRVRLDPEKADSRFVSYAMAMQESRDWLIRHAVGATMPNLNTGILSKLPVRAPRLLVQRSIGEVLGALDNKIAANRDLSESCVQLQGAFWGALTHDAPTTPLTKVARPHLGGTPSRSDDSAWDGHVLWASVRDLTAASGGVVFSTAERISREASRSARRLNELPAGTVVLTARGTVGEVAVLGVRAAINQSAYAFVPPEGTGVALRLSIEALRDSLRQHAHGSVFSTITMSTLAEAAIPDVFDDPSHHIIRRLELLEDRRISALRENLRLAATRDELLPLLMSGKITVKDAEKTVEEVL